MTPSFLILRKNWTPALLSEPSGTISSMHERTYATEGIILGRRNFGEADRILTIFTKHYGKMRVLAKGVRRPTSRKRGSLELFNHVRMFLVKGHNLDLITEVESKNTFSSWRKDLTKVAVAYHLAEVVARLTPEHQEHKDIFDLLHNAFSNLSGLDYWALYLFIQNFKVHVLEELGYLERDKAAPKNLDIYIEDLINGQLRTKRFLAQIKRN